MAEPHGAVRPSKSSRQPLLPPTKAGAAFAHVIALRKSSNCSALPLVIKVAPESMRFSIVLPAILTDGPAAPFPKGERTTLLLEGSRRLQRLAHIRHACAHRSDWKGEVVDLLGERLERNDSIKAVGVELAKLLDVA